MREVKATTSRLEAMLADVRQSRHPASRPRLTATLPHFATKVEMAEVLKTLPHLATRAELADKPGKAYLVSLLAVLITAYAAGLAALAILEIDPAPEESPCRPAPGRPTSSPP